MECPFSFAKPYRSISLDVVNWPEFLALPHQYFICTHSISWSTDTIPAEPNGVQSMVKWHFCSTMNLLIVIIIIIVGNNVQRISESELMERNWMHETNERDQPDQIYSMPRKIIIFCLVFLCVDILNICSRSFVLANTS